MLLKDHHTRLEKTGGRLFTFAGVANHFHLTQASGAHPFSYTRTWRKGKEGGKEGSGVKGKERKGARLILGTGTQETDDYANSKQKMGEKGREKQCK